MRSYIVRLFDGRVLYVASWTKGEVPALVEAEHAIGRCDIRNVRRSKGDPFPRTTARKVG
jgi:hypothetical protein